jgi:hypothetical protein
MIARILRKLRRRPVAATNKLGSLGAARIATSSEVNSSGLRDPRIVAHLEAKVMGLVNAKH